MKIKHSERAKAGKHSGRCYVIARYEGLDGTKIENATVKSNDSYQYLGYDHWIGVPTTDSVLLAGILGIAILLFIRKENK